MGCPRYGTFTGSELRRRRREAAGDKDVPWHAGNPYDCRGKEEQAKAKLQLNLNPSEEFPWQMFGLFVIILGAYAIALLLVRISGYQKTVCQFSTTAVTTLDAGAARRRNYRFSFATAGIQGVRSDAKVWLLGCGSSIGCAGREVA